MKRTPAEIEQMTPREAYAAGDADGREALTASLRRDEAAAKASETIEAKAKLDERLAAIERWLGVLQGDAEDRASSIADHSKRIAMLEARTP